MSDIKLLTDRDARIVDGKFQYNNGEKWVETQDAYKVYGIRINLSHSNPVGAYYIEDASGVLNQTDWDSTDIFKNIRPCVIRRSYGAPAGKKYLDKNNFSKFEDGTDATEYISDNSNTDVFIEIPKIGFKIVRDDKYLTILLTTAPNAAGFSYKAHSNLTEGDCNYIYVGAFLGHISDGILRSWAFKSPTHTTSLTDFRNAVSSPSTPTVRFSFGLFNFYTMTLLQCLYLMRYKNRNSQEALGMGYVGDPNWVTCAKTTGATLDAGMYHGSIDTMKQMKFMGIEDFWGNLYQWVDGYVFTENSHTLTCHIPSKMNDTGAGYDDLGQMTIPTGGYMKEPQGTNDLGFIPKVCGGSATTYFADYADLNAGCVPIFGGGFGDMTSAGAFRLHVCNKPSKTSGIVGGRLMLVASKDIDKVDSFEDNGNDDILVFPF